MREFIHRQKDRLALVRRVDVANDKLAIFVHGFGGNYLSTWGNLPQALALRADAEPPFADWDYLFLGYETRSITHLMSIAELIFTQWELAKVGDASFGQAYSRCALFSHSLGTLGMRQLLCATCRHPIGFIDALHSVSFFGSPLNGSKLAPFSKLAALIDMAEGNVAGGVAGLMPGSYSIQEAMRPDGPQLLMLKTWNESIRLHTPLPMVAVYQGADDAIVGNAATYEEWKGDTKYSSSVDHTQISKINNDAEWENSNFKFALLRGLK